MRRNHSRLTLRVSNVRVERVQDITIRDTVHEGIAFENVSADGDALLSNRLACPSGVHYDWIELWNSINAKRGYSWESNPFVWVVEWDKVWTQNVDEVS